MLHRASRGRDRGAWASLRWLLPLGVVLVCGLAACTDAERAVPEREERRYQRGKSLLREGRPEEALPAFLGLIEERRFAPESHLEAALIYLNTIEDPLAAIHHFRQFLMLAPESDQAPYVADQIRAAERQFLATLPGRPNLDDSERSLLLDQIAALRQRNAVLEAELQAARGALATARAAPPQALPSRDLRPRPSRTTAPQTQRALPPAPEPQLPPRPETYAVQEGDTLSNISRRFYGTSARWMDIFQANRDQLASPDALRAGQVIRLP